jgi:hypothetical protein
VVALVEGDGLDGPV